MSYPANTRSGSASFTVNKSTFSRYTINIQTYTTASWGASSKTVTRKFQLESGSTATSIEPYVGGQASPNPDYPQTIQTVTGEQTVEIVGKNLFDATATPWVQNVAYSNAGQQNWSGYYGINEYQPVESSTQYTFSNDLNKPIHYGVAYYNSSKSLIRTTIADTTTFTTPANCAYIRFAIQSATAPTWAQLELGSTASDYAPYSKQTLPLNLGSIELCKLGTYQDYIYKDGESWKVHKAISTITVDGSEGWSYNGDNKFNAANISGMAMPINADALCYCATHIGVLSAQNSAEFAPLVAGIPYATDVHKTLKTVRIKDIRFTEAQALKTWLSQNNTTIYYVVATATDTTITDQTLIAQLEAVRTASLQNGTNTITNTAAGSNLAGDMEIGYYGYNPTNRYDKFIWLDINDNYEQIGE